MSRWAVGAEVLRVLAVLPEIEWRRRRIGPAPLASFLRHRAAQRRTRTAVEREILKRAIRAVDGRLPGGPNCYRRALLEMGLDAAAAHEPLHLALRAHGGQGSGHAWLGAPTTVEDTAAYDARFVL